VRQLGRSGPANTPRLLKTLRNPLSSGVVSCVVAFPDCRHIAWYVIQPYITSFLDRHWSSASVDNLRLWNVADAAEGDGFGRMKSGAQFKIIPGHHGGYISQMSKALYPWFVILICLLSCSQLSIPRPNSWSARAVIVVGTEIPHVPCSYMISNNTFNNDCIFFAQSSAIMQCVRYKRRAKPVRFEGREIICAFNVHRT
jgi:hypothetical protein